MAKFTAKQIRDYCKKEYVDPVITRGDTVIEICPGKVQDGMGIPGNIAQVCGAIGASDFEKDCKMERICVLGPYQSPKTLFVFRLRKNPS